MKKLLFLIILCLPVYAQQKVFTEADYARAEKFLAQGVSRLVVGGSVRATWLSM